MPKGKMKPHRYNTKAFLKDCLKVRYYLKVVFFTFFLFYFILKKTCLHLKKVTEQLSR